MVPLGEELRFHFENPTKLFLHIFSFHSQVSFTHDFVGLAVEWQLWPSVAFYTHSLTTRSHEVRQQQQRQRGGSSPSYAHQLTLAELLILTAGATVVVVADATAVAETANKQEQRAPSSSLSRPRRQWSTTTRRALLCFEEIVAR